MTVHTPMDTTHATPLAPPAASSPLLRRSLWIGVPALLAIAAGVAVNRSEPATASAAPAPTVTVAAPLQRDVAQWDDFVGRFEPSRTVEVRARVSGAVTALHFTDGATVRPGQLLFTIDPRPFAAALAEARAGLASARSDLAFARANLDRANRLEAEDAVSKGELDQLSARVRAATAAIAAAEARVRARALDVEFTQVRAPIGGRISSRRVDPGNLVAGGDTSGTLLTTINALDPIYFTFDGSEALFLKGKRARVAGNVAPAVDVRLQDESDYRWHGKLDFTDNGFDPRSGTIRSRAVLANPDMFLTPGLFGNMRLASGGTTHALLVPDAAVQTDQARKTLLTVARDGTVVVKPVTLGPVVDGLRIVSGGLSRGDRVVIGGTQMAMPGTKVQVRAGRIAPVVAAPAPGGLSPTTGEATFTS